jgi:soluble lytic murein transglycosylase-like protein
MAADRFHAVVCALAGDRSRRSALGAMVAAGLAALSADANPARGACRYHDSEQQILHYIAKAAKKYNQSKKAMVRVARCESSFDPCAVNRSGPYYGLYQFLKSTWKSTPYGNHNIFDPKAQAMAAGWMWQQGRKNEWACK